MKKFVLILIIVFPCCLCYCQEIPILFDTATMDIHYYRKRLEIKDSKLTDSLRITFKVAIEFENALSDTTKVIEIKSFKLMYLDVSSLSTNTQYRIDLSENSKLSISQKDIWSRYSKILKHWYMNQPYAKMIYRSAYGKKIYFGGILYLKP